MLQNTMDAYGPVSKFLHWLLFFMVTGMLIFGLSLAYVPKDYQAVAYNLHKLTGLSILTLMILWLIWTIFNNKPAMPIGMPKWQDQLKRWVHGLLYCTLILMPIAGWVGASFADKPPHLGALALKLPIAKNESLSDLAFFLHNTIAFIIIALITIHVLAAFYHHFILKDNILRRMLPKRMTR